MSVTKRGAENIETNKTDKSFLCLWGKTDNKPNKHGLLVMEKNKVGKELWSVGAGVGIIVRKCHVGRPKGEIREEGRRHRKYSDPEEGKCRACSENSKKAGLAAAERTKEKTVGHKVR